MWRDAWLCCWGEVVFAALLAGPGYLAGTACLPAFERRGLLEQIAWSIALSFGVVPLVLCGCAWLAGISVASACVTAAGCIGFVLFALRTWWRWSPAKEAGFILCLVLAISVFAIGSLIDIGIGNHLYMSVTKYDNALRSAFVDAVLRTGVPPSNPVYWPGHDAPMHYYFFWYVVCAAVAKAAHVSPMQALIASSAWSVFGVVAVLGLFARHVLDWRGGVLWRRWWVAVGLMVVTGFDGVIALLAYLGSGTVARDIEWWSIDQVSSWADTFLWVPHHAAGLTCSVTCVLLLSVAASQERSRRRNAICALAGVCFASAFGVSTYVACCSAVVLCAWMCSGTSYSLLLKRGGLLLRTALVSAVLLAPYLVFLLRQPPGARHASGHVFAFGVRLLLPPAVLYNVPGIHQLQQTHPFAAEQVSALLLLLPSYFLELGFFASALWMIQRWRNKHNQENTLLWLTWAGLLACSFVRSRVISMNDYSIRASLISQFCLLFIGVLAIERSRSMTRYGMYVLLGIGAAGSIYQVGLLRTYLPFHESIRNSEYEDLSQQTYALREAYARLPGALPDSARVQYSVRDLGKFGYRGFARLAELRHQVIVDGEGCNDSFGGEAGPCEHIETNVAQLFPARGEHAPAASQAVELCRSVGIDALIATRWDAAWANSADWVWTLPVAVAEPEVRVLRCTAEL